MTADFKYSFKASPQTELSLTVYNAGFQKCPPDYGWGPGVRDHYLLHYVVSGRGRHEVDNRTFVLSSGDAFLIPPDVPVLYQADHQDPWEYYWVGFSGASAKLLLNQTSFSRQTPVLHVAQGEQLRQGLLDIYNARGSDYASAIRMAGYLQAALGLLMQTTPHTGREALADYAHQGALYLRRNYSRSIGVEELARQAGISRSHLFRAFQAEFQCSPSTYLTRYRMQRACQLLRHSQLSVSAVAASVGYEDPFYFSRAFKREQGISPSEYRSS